MKQATIKNILFVCMIAGLMGNSAHAAVGDWIARKKQQAKEYVLRKINDAELKTKELLSVLRANTSCLVRGDCPVAKRKQLRALAGAITTAIAVVTAAAVVSRLAKDEPVPELAISPPAGMKIVSRVAIAEKHGIDIKSAVRRETPESQMLFAAETGGSAGMEQVTSYGDFVADNVLRAAIEIADVRGNREVENYLVNLRKSNDLLIEKVNAGVLAKVKEVYCTLEPRPSSWAMSEGVKLAQARMKQYQEGGTARRVFTEILNFLRQPQCAW